MDHKIFIAWAFSRHCTTPHNSDFEVCQDIACQRAVKYEQEDNKLPFTDTSPVTPAEEADRAQNER